MKTEYGIRKKTTKPTGENTIVIREKPFMKKQVKSLEEIKEENRNSFTSDFLWWTFCMTIVILGFVIAMAKI